MKNYWFCICDFGHSETFLLDENQDITSVSTMTCAQGHEFVTVSRSPMADVVEVRLRSHAHIDEVTGKVCRDNNYYIVLFDHIGERERVSRKTYSWDEIVNPTGYLHWFRKVDANKAWKLMDVLDKR